MKTNQAYLAPHTAAQNSSSERYSDDVLQYAGESATLRTNAASPAGYSIFSSCQGARTGIFSTTSSHESYQSINLAISNKGKRR